MTTTDLRALGSAVDVVCTWWNAEAGASEGCAGGTCTM